MELVSSFTKSEHAFRILFMKHELTKTIGGAVRYLRNYRGLTAMELAEKVGISDRHVYEIERGTVLPRAKTFDAIAAALEVPIHFLFFPFQYEYLH